MPGSDQSKNLAGMFQMINDPISQMGNAGNQYVETLRQSFRPSLNMDDPQSMAAYAEWLRRNGKEEEARQLSAQQAALVKERRQRKGEASIAAMAAQLTPGMDEDKRKNIMASIAAVAERMDISPITVGQILEDRNLARREQSRKEQDTDSAIATRAGQLGLDKERIDNDLRIALDNLELGNNRLAETMRSNLAGETLTARGLDQDQDQFEANLKQRQNEFSLNYSLDVDRFEEEQRMNAHAIKIDDEQIKQGWAGLSLDERRVVVSEQLKDNEISFTEFKQLIMGDENRRLNELQPYEIEAKKASIKVALANAGYTEAQTERVLYDLGFERSVREYREDIVKYDAELGAANVGLTKARTENVRADTARTKKDIDRILADTKLIRARTGYQDAATEAVIADMHLDERRYNLAERQQFWNEGMDEARLRLEEIAQNSGIDLNSAQIENLESLMESRQFQDNMLAMETMGKGVSEAYKAAYSMTFDVLNPTAVSNARIQFYNVYGAGPLLDFDAALKEKIKLRELQVNVQGLQQGLEDKKPPTRGSLQAAGFSDEAIDVVMGLPASQRNQAILGEAQRLLEPATGGRVTEAHLNVTKPRAKEMFYATFGDNWWGPIPTGNGVWDDEVIDKVNWALAEANAAGLPAHEAVNRGVAAMLPYLSEVGGGAVQNLDNFIRSMGGD